MIKMYTRRIDPDVQAIRFIDTAQRIREVADFLEEYAIGISYSGNTPVLNIYSDTWDIIYTVDSGDYIIRNSNNDVYPSPKEEFEEIFKEAGV